VTEKPLAPTILTVKQHDAPSVFAPANLLREARRQRGLPDEPVPAVCALDPDGDIVRYLRVAGTARKAAGWACYHTDMDVTDHAGVSIGIVGCAVGAPFAVLVAEQLFVSGCRFLVSITSAGQIAPKGPLPYFVLIDRALRDEGTSIICRHRPSPSRITLWPIVPSTVSPHCRMPFIAAPRGPRTLPIAKRKEASPLRVRRVRSPWRWKPRRFTPSRWREATQCCALPM
jgi:hypothetical protein